MATSKEISAKAQKIRAYKELLKIAKEGSFDVYFTLNRLYGKGKAIPLNCLDPITHRRNREPALNETLCLLAQGDPAIDVEHLEKERHIIQLALTAGADPNCSSPYGFPDESILDTFIHKGKAYGALEVAKTDKFVRSKALDKTFRELACSLDYYLVDGLLFPDFWDTKEEYDLYRHDVADKIELVYVLFSKGMTPSDPKIFKSLQPLYAEEKNRIAKNISRQSGHAPRGRWTTPTR